MIVSISTVSKSQSDSSRTTIKYSKLEEFAKFVDYRFEADSILYKYRSELHLKDSLIVVKDQRIHDFEFIQIPSLMGQIDLSKKDIQRFEDIIALKEENFKTERKRLRIGKRNWGIGGVVIGILISLFLTN